MPQRGVKALSILSRDITSRKVAGSRTDEVNFFNLPNLPAILGPGVYSTSNRNEYQKQKNVSGE
jgi:hypothetical protein